MKISEGQAVKWYWGYAWRNYNTATNEVFVIPFNLILRWIRNVWLWLRIGPWATNAIDRAHQHGYNEAADYYTKEIDKLQQERQKVYLMLKEFQKSIPNPPLPK